jgi:DNA-binding XRE family transcriptional regulator
MNRNYSDFEKQIIQLHFAKGGSRGCQGFIKRSKDSIQHQARKLGIQYQGKRNQSYRAFKISKHAHPLVKTLFMEIIKQRYTQKEVAKFAGLSRNTMHNWNSVIPRLADFVAVCNAVDLDLKIVRVPA